MQKLVTKFKDSVEVIASNLTQANGNLKRSQFKFSL